MEQNNRTIIKNEKKENGINQRNNSSGITLIALVVSIVVLIILAVVSINVIFGENGIISRAELSKEKTEIARIKEEAELVKADLIIDNLGSTVTKSDLIIALKEHFEGSTLENGRVVVENGKYDIVVKNNLDIVVVKHGEDVALEADEIGIRYEVEEVNSETKKIKVYLEVVTKPYEEYAAEILAGITENVEEEKEQMFIEGSRYMGYTSEEGQDCTDFIEYMSNDYGGYGFAEGEAPTTLEEFRIWANNKWGSAYETVDEILIDSHTVNPEQYDTLYPNENFTVTCSNGATVQTSGYVEFIVKDNGVYTITAETESGKYGETVVEIGEIIHSLTLSTNSVEIKKNEILNITATTNSTKDLIWTSSDETIATVEGSGEGNKTGTIVGKKEGTVTITVQNEECTLQTCEVSVVLYGLTLSTNSVKIEKGDTLNITATTNSTENLIWTSSDETIATVEGSGEGNKTGIVVGKELGTATITVQNEECTPQICEVIVYEEKFSQIYQETAEYTSNGKTAWIPAGFAVGVSEEINSIDTGLVITDSVDSNGYSNGNEFVWVPVDEISDIYDEANNAGQLWDFGTYSSPKNPAVKLAYPTTQNSGNREPDVVTAAVQGANSARGSNYDAISTNLQQTGFTSDLNEDGKVNAYDFKIELQNEFDAMIASVREYGGFYIGRYETGNLSQSTAVVQKGNTDIGSKTWYTMYAKCKTIGEGKGSVTSSMIWGSLWDATLRWMQNSTDPEVAKFPTDSTGKGNYAGTQGSTNVPIPTGTNSVYSVNNIYDMAGNVSEWTLEAGGTGNRVGRGGTYSSSASTSPASNRGSITPPMANDNVGCRSYLYVTLGAKIE